MDKPPRPRPDPALAGSRSPSRGPSFLYVAPCAGEEILKLGMSRDPLSRLQAIHPRYFEFFDLDRCVLVETETVRDAGRLELRLGHALAEHRAPAPLVASAEAGGHSEWYRGAYQLLLGEVQALGLSGHVLHLPARAWFERTLQARADQLHSWACALFPAADEHRVAELAAALLPQERRRLRDLLDAYPALGVDLAQHLPEPVLRWYQGLA